MSAPSALRGTAKLYQNVIDDVVNSARESFFDEGIDETVLKEFKELWESKLKATKAIDLTLDDVKPFLAPVQKNSQTGSPNFPPVEPGPATPNPNFSPKSNPVLVLGQRMATSSPVISNLPQNVITLPPGTSVLTHLGNVQGATVKLLKAPVAPGSPSASSGSAPRTFAVPIKQENDRMVKYLIVPQLNLGNNLAPISAGNGQNNSTGPKIDNLASSSENPSTSNNNTNSSVAKKRKIAQLDGPGGVSDNEEDGDEFSVEEEDNLPSVEDDEDELACQAGIVEEGEPLNSDDDDLTNENADELFEADDVIVCQYEKVVRSRNRWKFQLKDGIMNLRGKDYVFNKAIGESEF